VDVVFVADGTTVPATVDGFETALAETGAFTNGSGDPAIAGTFLVRVTAENGKVLWHKITVTVIPTIGITGAFNSLSTLALPVGLEGIKDVTGDQQLVGVSKSITYSVLDPVAEGGSGTFGALLDSFRALTGSVAAVTWNHSGETNTFWVNTDLDNVRADVTLTGGTGSADNAYLLVWDGSSTFEIIKGGFFAKYVGNTIEGGNGLNKVSSLTFGATAPGTYIVKIAINKVNGTTGAVEAHLAEQTLTFTVSAASVPQ
jgi:hypothetical protein